jgi:hypothetical protein
MSTATGDVFSESDIQGWQCERERTCAIAKSIVERRATGHGRWSGGEQEKVEKGASVPQHAIKCLAAETPFQLPNCNITPLVMTVHVVAFFAFFSDLVA